LVQKIEQQLIAQGKLDTESETASFCEKEGIYVTGAEDKDVKTVQKFLQVLSMVLLNGPDDFGITVKLLEPDTTVKMGSDEDTAGDKAALQKAEVDKWALKELKASGKQWGEKNCAERVSTVLMTISKVVLVLLLLYMFIISLGLMGNAFKVLGGKSSGKAFRQSELFANPVAGLAIGILATVLVQSSSTSTSVIITMSAADLISMQNAIPMIMGANIGTSVTASIVSVAHVGDKDQYRRAFGGAVVHYCFNILTVCVLMPVEVFFRMLEHLSGAMVDAFGISNDDEKGGKQDFLKVITKPVSSRLLQVDKKLVTKIAEEKDEIELAKLEKKSIIQQSQSKDNHLFMDTPMSDNVAGALLIIVSLLFLSVCLMLLVKTLQSIFKGRVAIWMGKFLNLEFKSVPLVGDYILMTFGLFLTILMQSSSVTTSALTPLVGIGLIRVEKMFPFTIGANIGTTVTGILAALASSNMKIGFQVAMSHLLFNVFGTLIWFAVPATRAVPMAMAKFLGNLAADVKLFPVFLIVFAWVLMPVLLLGLSIAGIGVVGVIGGLILLVSLAVILVIWLRSYYPRKLPGFLARNPKWLPPTLRIITEEDVKRAASFHSGAVGTSDGPVDTDKIGSAWWQAVLAWGSGWFILMMLVTAVPNCQWGNLKYPKFDGRDHVGIGAWQTCSAMFEEKVDWASSRSECSASDLSSCATIKDCKLADFSDQKGSNKDYEKSWVACRKMCSPKTWETHCLNMACGGSQHTVQCNNVTKAVHQDFQVSYMTGTAPAWSAGDRCRSVSEICDNGSTLQQIGSLGWTSFAFLSIGQIMLVVHGSVSNKAKKLKLLMGSCSNFAIGWIFLLVTWAMFASAVGSKTTCTVMDASTTGAIRASGNFGDIIMASGSYSYYFIIGSWILTTLVIVVLVEHIFTERKKAAKTGMKSADI
jgi:sodium-dependent phosphate cotransporter